MTPAIRTLKVGHVRPNIRVQGVDHHLAVCGSGDLYSPVDKSGSWRRALPSIVFTDVFGFWEEVQEIALVEFGLSDHSSLEKRFPALVERAMEKSKKDGGIFAQDVSVLVVQFTEDVDLS